MFYREFTPADAPEMAAIYNHYVNNGVELFETNPISNGQMLAKMTAIAASYPCFVADDNGRMAGFCYAHAWKTLAAYARTYEVTIYLLPEYKGRGIGSELMRRLIDDCRRRGCKALIASITGGNEASIALHRKFGFTQASYFRNVGYKNGQWLDDTDYELLL